MLGSYIPILIFILVAITLPVVGLLVGRLLRPHLPTADKLMPYECGVDPVDDARGRFSVRFYIIAILFVIFDVETIFLFPWAVIYDKLALFGFIEMVIFLGILIVGVFLRLEERRTGMGIGGRGKNPADPERGGAGLSPPTSEPFPINLTEVETWTGA